MGHGSCGSLTGQLNDGSRGSRVTKCDPLSALLHTVVKLNIEGAFSDKFDEFYFIFKRLGQLLMKAVLKVCVDGHGRRPGTSLSNAYTVVD